MWTVSAGSENWQTGLYLVFSIASRHSSMFTEVSHLFQIQRTTGTGVYHIENP